MHLRCLVLSHVSTTNMLLDRPRKASETGGLSLHSTLKTSSIVFAVQIWGYQPILFMLSSSLRKFQIPHIPCHLKMVSQWPDSFHDRGVGIHDWGMPRFRRYVHIILDTLILYIQKTNIVRNGWAYIILYPPYCGWLRNPAPPKEWLKT